ncbi:PREDICTED: enoyl-CoA hydratase domain-containing protein 3, mitochondrial-like [Rhagoletis zephyria]|uniref:enoyl-CoA hydratase domain-containing protein 3, mitochondrial-like n=1 Tax=Rhagoletis zephyria TaxID=28612 RepID=UPI0008113B2F|nr:PREDICTED: enoyl-CoA hydratase domain-containing protein 3, mitochondrial-like [Rhagoletis zephyria]
MLRTLYTSLAKSTNLTAAAMAPLLGGSNRNQSTIIKQSDGVREIILNDPRARNTLSREVMASILEGITKDAHDEELRCIVISSTGPVWSAGHNLKEISASTDGGCEIFSQLVEIIMNIYKSSVPIIAKVNGMATAAGLQLAASCDMVVASDKASFAASGINLGIFCTTPGIAISRIMPRMRSSYLLFTGFPMKAPDALAAGLASVVVPEAELDAETDKITKSIKEKSRAVIAMGKVFYYKQLEMGIKEAYEQGTNVMVENIRMDDAQEGLKSFAEKRKPNWSKL